MAFDGDMLATAINPLVGFGLVFVVLLCVWVILTTSGPRNDDDWGDG